MQKEQFTYLEPGENGRDSRSVWAVIFTKGSQLVVSPKMAQQLLAEYPSLAYHACKSSKYKKEVQETPAQSLGTPGISGAAEDSGALEAAEALETLEAIEAPKATDAASAALKKAPSVHGESPGGSRSTFGECIEGALLPHAIEHLTIELLVQAHPGEVFAGNTRWVSREEQAMCVRIMRSKRVDDEEIMSTLSRAMRHLNGLLALC